MNAKSILVCDTMIKQTIHDVDSDTIFEIEHRNKDAKHATQQQQPATTRRDNNNQAQQEATTTRTDNNNHKENNN